MLSKIQKFPSCLFFSAPRITREAEVLLRIELLNLKMSFNISFLSSKQVIRILGVPSYPGRVFALYDMNTSLITQIPLIFGKYFQRNPELLFWTFKIVVS